MADDLLHPFVRGALRDTIIRLQAQEFDVARDVAAIHDRLFPSFLEELHRYFLQHFYTTLGTDKQPVWDLVTAKALGTEAALEAMVDDFLDTLGEELDPLLDEASDDSADDGYLTGLWMSRVAGVDEQEIEDASNRLVTPALIGGLSMVDRARQWRTLYRDKLLTSMRASIATSATIGETSNLTQFLWGDYVRSVTAMASNDVYWGFTAGAHEAYAYLAAFVDEVWVTEDDYKVCLICGRRHMTRTPLQPIWDSHPGCRCIKAPILLVDGEPLPLDYDVFVNAIMSGREVS